MRSDRAEEAERELTEALDREPYDGLVALALAKLKLADGRNDAAVQALAQRAVRLGGGGAARDLLDQVRVAEAK